MIKALSVFPENAWSIINLDKRIGVLHRRIPNGLQGFMIAIHATKEIGGGGSWIRKRDSISKMITDARQAGWNTSHQSVHSEYRCSFYKDENSVNFRQDELVLGAIVAVARIDNYQYPESGIEDRWRVSNRRFHYVLRDLVKLVNPIPCKGAHNFWTVSSSVEDQIVFDPVFDK